MKANKYISKREYKLLLIVALTAFVYILSAFIWRIVEIYDYSVSEPQFSGRQDNLPAGLHFLTLFIFVALLVTKRFLLSSFLTVFYAVIFIYGLSARHDGARLGGEEHLPKIDFLDQVYRVATDFDCIAALFISTLLFWQISILLRMLIKTSHRKIELS